MYAVFDFGKVPKADVDQVLQTPGDARADLVSRQSLAFRDGKILGFPDLGTVVLVEGTEDALKAAAELFAPHGKRLDAGPAEAVHKKVKSEEDAAAAGMGFVFG